jgi:hypothetical protein
VSARDRAFSREPREGLQEALEATTDGGEPNVWATRFRKATERKRVYLDEFFSDLDLRAMESTLKLAKLNPRVSDEHKNMAYSKLSAGLTALGMLYEKPQQVKQRAPEIKALITEGYQELNPLGYGFPAGTNAQE